MIGLEVTCSLLIHAFCALFEVNQLRNTGVIGEKPSKTSKIGCFSNFDGPPDPKSKIGLRNDMQFCITQILRGHWRKSVEKQKSLCIYQYGGRGRAHHQIIKWKYIYNTHWQASDLPRLFLSARGGSLSVGGVVLRSDALASALMCIIMLYRGGGKSSCAPVEISNKEAHYGHFFA